MKRGWLLVVGGVALAPLVTWLPMLAARFPRLGLPAYPPAEGGDLWEMQTFWLVALGVIAVIVGARDRWLGLAVAIAGLTIFLRGARMDPTHSVLFALGALLLGAVRLAPRDMLTLTAIRTVLVGCAFLQIVYVIQQRWGHDVLWGPLFGGTLNPVIQPIGTLLGVDAVSSYLAILTPLLPLWLLPFALYVVVASQSLGAVLALGVGLAVQYFPWNEARAWRTDLWTSRMQFGVVAVSLAVLIAMYAYPAHMFGKETQKARVGIWQFAATEYVKASPVLGWGLGGWAARVPALQQQRGYLPTNEYFREAHNEPLQWIVETGAVGLLLLGLWLWDHRRMFAHPVWGGSLAALASDSLSWHPFHIVALALLGITLIGLATQEEAPA